MRSDATHRIAWWTTGIATNIVEGNVSAAEEAVYNLIAIIGIWWSKHDIHMWKGGVVKLTNFSSLFFLHQRGMEWKGRQGF